MALVERSKFGLNELLGRSPLIYALGHCAPACWLEASAHIVGTHVASLSFDALTLALTGRLARLAAISCFQEAVLSDVLRPSEDPLATACNALWLRRG